MGEVYAAYDPDLDRRVALKLIHPDLAARDSRAGDRLLREAQVMARLAHPNVVVVHDVGQVEGRVFIAMEFVEGVTLSAWLGEKTRSWPEIIDAFVQAGRGLAAAHRAGIVHRDFKPQNVMIGSDGVVRMVDFGLAQWSGADDIASEPSLREAPPDAALTLTGERLGTPLYMAPEQSAGAAVDARSDQFSYCVSLYWALFGTHPFGATQIDRPRAGPAWVRRALVRGLSKNPSTRWGSMDQLLAALGRDRARRRRAISGFVGILAACAIVGVAAARITSVRRAICDGGQARVAVSISLARQRMSATGADLHIAARSNFARGS
jgi:serine/threonine protein kinase